MRVGAFKRTPTDQMPQHPAKENKPTAHGDQGNGISAVGSMALSEAVSSETRQAALHTPSCGHALVKSATLRVGAVVDLVEVRVNVDGGLPRYILRCHRKGL